MNKKLTVPGIAAVVALLIGFGAGYYAPHGVSSARGQFGNGQFTSGQFAGRTGNITGASRAGGFTSGEVLSKDTSSITVKMQDGSTKLVLLGANTEVLQTASTTADSISVGRQVVVTGTSNSDGSISAGSIQIRPADGSGFKASRQ